MKRLTHSILLVIVCLGITISISNCSSDDSLNNGSQSINQPQIEVFSVSPDTIRMDSNNDQEISTVNIFASVNISNYGQVDGDLLLSIRDLDTKVIIKTAKLNGGTITPETDLYPEIRTFYSNDLTLDLTTTSNYNLEFRVTGIGYGGQVISAYSNVLAFSSNNTPPVIEELIYPEEVTLPSTGSMAFRLQAKVSDADGMDDIASVILQLYNESDDSFITSFNLKDDGSQESADIAARDSIYTVGLSVNSTNQAQNYTLRWFALDKLNTSSDTTISSLKFIRP